MLTFTIQLQIALKEFDFLQSHDDTVEIEDSPQEFYPAPPAQFANDRSLDSDGHMTNRNNGSANVQPSNAFNTQKSFAPDLLRPVLTMPPVVLMGAPVTPSPIIEEPPSPAPNQMPMVEYPEEEYYGENVDDDYLDINVEVRKQIQVS